MPAPLQCCIDCNDEIPLAVLQIPKTSKSRKQICELLRVNNALLQELLQTTTDTAALLANLQQNPSTKVLTDEEMQQLSSMDCSVLPTCNRVERLLEVAKKATMIGQGLSPDAREWLLKRAVEAVLQEP